LGFVSSRIESQNKGSLAIGPYSFATAWHPDSQTFATRNQDKTCRIWDTRNLLTSLAVLWGNIGAIQWRI
jgi:WD40 repeat protein